MSFLGRLLGIGPEPGLEIRLCEPVNQAREEMVWWGHLEIENVGLSSRVKHAKTAEHARIFVTLDGVRHEMMWQSTSPQREMSLIHKNPEKVPLVLWAIQLGLGWHSGNPYAYHLTDRTFLVDRVAETEIPPGDHEIGVEVIWGDGQRKNVALMLHLPKPYKGPLPRVPDVAIEVKATK